MTTTQHARLDGRRTRAILEPVASALLAIMVLSLVTFAATSFRSPREQAIAALGHEASSEQLDVYIALNGLDRSFPVRYWDWLSGVVVEGGFGTSTSTGAAISEQLIPRLQNTVVLASASMLLAVLIAIPLGIYMAHRANTIRGLTLSTAAVVVASIPEFVIGVFLIFLFAVTLDWLPVDSSSVTSGTIEEQLLAYVLPVATLTLAVVPYVARICKAGVQEALESMTVRSARLRGLSAWRIEMNHSLRLAAIPIIGAVAISGVSLLGGVLVVENVFGFPGLGQLAVTSLQAGDIPTVQACSITLGALIVATNMIAEMVALRFNPKLRGTAT